MSSAVKHRIGAASVAIARRHSYITTCAARRAGESTRVGVQPILRDVAVERREVDGDEVDEQAVHDVQLVRLVRLARARDDVVEPREQVAIDAERDESTRS